MRGYSNKPEPNRASRVVDVGLASRATRVRLTSTIKGNADAENQTKYGLLGLLDVIRMTNADLNTLALGSDLTTLGLNLNSSECLYSTFASPWAEAPITREPQFSLPLCYYMQPPPLKTSHLSKFQLETLFYIFYAMPKDVLQAYAAQELYNREWQYHQDLKLWFKRSSSADGLNFSNNQYIFFDIKTWECRVFSNMHAAGNFSDGLLHEDSVRVKFMNSS
jgi:CCR4-NOT transcription complex subunit 2